MQGQRARAKIARVAAIACACLFGAAAAASVRAAEVATRPAPAKSETVARDRPLTQVDRLDGVEYRIDIPAGWNRGLVVFYHGYAIDPVTFKGETLSGMFAPILAAGYAVIQSAYSSTGWAIEQASADTEKLRRHFGARFGKPRATFAMGMSMGGALTVMAAEKTPDVYDGALSLCGAIEPTDRFMQRDFALRAAFDHYVPDLLGPLVPVPADYTPDGRTVARIAAALRHDPKAFSALRALYGVGDLDSLPGVLAFITYDIKEMQQRTRGNPFGNADLIYTGSGDDYALNDGVRRYVAEPKAAAYMARWYTPSGRLERPLLALHDTADPLVVASTAFEYALLVQRAGHAQNFVQQYVNAEGHCVFTPAQIGAAFGELVEWTRTGKRPLPGRQR